jgi:hypothetical protein
MQKKRRDAPRAPFPINSVDFALRAYSETVREGVIKGFLV